MYFHGWKCRTYWQAAGECVQINLSVCKFSGVWLGSHWYTLTAVQAQSQGLQLFNLQVQEVWITLILEKTLQQFPKGLWSVWTWTDHCTAHQNKTITIKEAKWSKVPGLSCRSRRRSASVHAFENSWTDHGDSTALGRAGGQGHNAAAHGQQDRRAGELGQVGSRQTFTLVILPLGRGSFASLNGSALPEEQGWGVRTPQHPWSSPWIRAYPSVHRAAGQGQAGIWS